MEKQQYIEMIEQVLNSMSGSLEDVKRCLPSHDKQCLKDAEKEFRGKLVGGLPLVTEVIAQEHKSELEKRFLLLVPSLQKMAQAMETILARTRTKIESQILFTDKGMSELKQIISEVKDLARDTKDALATDNPHLKKHIRKEMEETIGMANDFALEHQERLVLGFCTPQASYLYVDMLDALKRIARELVYLSEKG
jgi:Na+/phosphate symporter